MCSLKKELHHEITDLEPYCPHIDNFDLTKEQKLELVNAIKQIAEMILNEKFSAHFAAQKKNQNHIILLLEN